MNLIGSIDGVCSFWNDRSDDKFLVGVMVQSDDEFALFESINADGFLDGFVLCRTDDIFRVSYNDRYSERIKFLFDLHGEKHPEVQRKATVFDTFLSLSKLSYGYAAFLLVNGDIVTGKNFELYDDTLRFDAYDEEGFDGHNEILADSIISGRCNSHYEKLISSLLKNKTGGKIGDGSMS